MKSAGKILLIIVINIVVTVILLEVGTLIIYPYIKDRKFSPGRIREKLGLPVQGEIVLQEPYKKFDYVENRIVHPYLGFVYDPKIRTPDKSLYYGFPDGELIKHHAEDEVIIGISGGSVAQSLFANAKDILLEELKKSPYLKNKTLRIVSFAVGGYKQPQQLITLSYLLSLGGVFDIWINLDGFNEVTLSMVENWEYGISLIYPRFWPLYFQRVNDRETLDKMLEIHKNHKQRKVLRAIFSNRLLSKSVFCLALWENLDQRKESLEYVLNQELEGVISQKESSYQVTGPFSEHSTREEAMTESVRIWMRTSVQTSGICKAFNIKYYHFLQPNQYYEGSKVFNEEEKRIAYAKRPSAYKTATREGYPLLVRYGKELKQQGIPFYDLTLIFKNEPRTVYADKLCHLNILGNRLLAENIAKIIVSDYTAENGHQ